MVSTSLKKPFIVSLVSHLALFGLFTFSFGPRLTNLDASRVSFLGGLLTNNDLNMAFRTKTGVSLHEPHFPVDLPSAQKENKVSIGYAYPKPEAVFISTQDKPVFYSKQERIKPLRPKSEQSMMFYPEMPYHFLLYFKDRQVANIEIVFNLTSAEGINSINVKRKISSGNLEVDLLSMRYISHYLFVQRNRFPLNQWQSVKIELQAKDDSH